MLNYEPAMALFVPDNDPFIFYRTIADFGKNHLNPGGMIYTEIIENRGKEVMQIFQAAGYNAEMKKDMQGKERMVKSQMITDNR